MRGGFLLSRWEERGCFSCPNVGERARFHMEILQDRLIGCRIKAVRSISILNKGYAEENTGSIFGFDARSDGCAHYELYERNPGFK